MVMFPVNTNANSSDGTVTMVASSSKATIGEEVSLTVTVSGIEGTGKGANYTITVPEGIVTKTANSTTSTSDNGDYSGGVYTSNKGGTYTFSLNVTKGSAGDPSTATVSFVPATPTANAATNVTSTSFDANWDAVASAESYTVEIINGAVANKITDVTGTSYNVTGLTPNTDYSYKIYAVNNGVESETGSNEIEVTTLSPEVTIDVLSLLFSALPNSSETKSFNITSKDLYGDIAITLNDANGVYAIDKTSIDKATASGTINVTFSPKVHGNYPATVTVSSGYAEDQTVTLNGSGLSLPPTALTASGVGSSTFIANWSAVDDATDYKLTVYDTNGVAVDGYDGLSVGNVTTYEVSNLYPETTYNYKVAAVVDGNTTALSNAIEVTTIKGPVITYVGVSGFEAGVGTTATKTVYLEGVNLTKNITVTLTGDNFSTETSSIAVQSDGTASGAVEVKYEPTAIGTSNGKLSIASEGVKTIELSLVGTASPEAPVVSAATGITTTGFTANWNGSASDYRVNIIDGDGNVSTNTVTGSLSYNATDLTSGATYTYNVQAYESGVLSAKSSDIFVTTLAAPTATAVAGQDYVQVAWGEVANATGYKVTLYDADGTQKETKTVTALSNTFSGLTSGTTYKYDVTSLYDGGYTAKSTVSSIATVASSSYGYGEQVENSDFEAWESVSGTEEPVEWSSFMSAQGDFANTAKGEQVKSSTNVRSGSTGVKSAYIWTRNVLNIANANGNLTNGRINAGAMDATSLSNHNSTIITETDYNQTLTSRPDSITVWVKFSPNSSSSTASISAFIHGNYDSFQDPLNDASKPYVVAYAQELYKSCEWTRKSVAFDYDSYTSNKVNPAYILITFNTNSTPGSGSADDNVTIDDMLLIYNPTLSMGNLSKTKYATGEEISVSYTLTGTMSPYNLNAEKNVVSLQLSDATGGFDNPTTLASQTTDFSGILTAKLPSDLSEGTGYKVRVVTTNYPMQTKGSARFAIYNKVGDAVATNATTTSVSLTANWEAADNATSYDVTLKDSKGNVVTTENTSETTYTFRGLAAETTYSFYVVAKNDNSTSARSNEIVAKTAGGGSITYEGETTFTNSKIGVPQTTTLTISGTGLTADIYASISGSSDFSIDKTSIPVEGGDIVVTYTPSAIGTQTATITLKSKLVNPNVTITLKGNVAPDAVEAKEASDVTINSFTANWNASLQTGAEYVLTLYDADGTELKSEVTSTTSYSITGCLEAATTYKYAVAVRINGLTSAESEQISVTTNSLPVINSVEDVIFDEFVLGSAATQKSVILSGSNLTGKINVALSGTNSDMFSIDKTAAVNGEEITISYNPNATGNHSAMVTLSTESAMNDVTFALSGSSTIGTPVMNEATIDSDKGYTVTWSEVPGAEYYLVYFKYEASDGTLADYSFSQVAATAERKSSVTARSLRNTMNYCYVVACANAGTLTKESEHISISLIKPAAIDASDATDVTETSFTANWNASKEENVKYIVVVSNNGVEVRRAITSTTSLAVTDLTAGTEYSYSVATLSTVNGLSSAASAAITVKTAGEVPVTSVKETDAVNITVYPNPAVSEVNIGGVKVKSYTLYTADGKKTGRGKGNVINVTGLTNGIYKLVIVTSDNNVYSRSIIKK